MESDGRRHDNPVRKVAYDPANYLPDNKIGTFTQALVNEARTKVPVISIKRAFK
jgi:hypothetical protein